jgi:extracellular matrix protein 14
VHPPPSVFSPTSTSPPSPPKRGIYSIMNLKKLYLVLPALIQWSKIDPVSAGALRQHDFLAALQTAPEPEINLGPQGWTARVVDSLGFGRRNRRADPYKSLTQYKDDLVLRFTISNEAEARAIAGAANQLFLDVWSASNKSMDIRLSPHDLPLVLSFLPESMKNNYTPMMSNILDSIPQSRIEGQKTDTLFFGDYQPWNVILPWMKLLESMFPSYVELLTIGQTHEGRDIHALKVGASEEEDGKRRRADGEQRRTVIITGAAHAREWISVSTVNYLAYSIITGYAKNDKGIDAMVNNIDWIFIPTLNVDGYVYTWEKDRLWRKNRQPTNLAFCQGIDLDRAYDFHFDNSPQSAANPCSESMYLLCSVF